MSKNTELVELGCTGNRLTSLDVSKNLALDTLSCGDNRLTSLDVSMLTELDCLYCASNELMSLDVSKNTALDDFECDSNQLTSLDVSNNTVLWWLSCSSNQLTSLDVSKNTHLRHLYCNANQLTSLDVSQNTDLYDLFCDANRLTSLDMSNIEYLEKMSCEGNILPIDLAGDNRFDLKALPGFVVGKASNWTGGTVDGDGILTVDADAAQVTYAYDIGQDMNATFTLELTGGNNGDVPIDAEHFPDEAFRSYVSGAFDQDHDGVLSESEIANATKIEVYEEDISDLTGVQYFTALVGLQCEGNRLTSLDVSKNTALELLYCYSNQLTSLDVSQNTALKELYCHTNPLMRLDVSKNTALEKLVCSNNQLTSLDVSQNTALKELYCHSNQLTSLDVSQNTALEDLYCEENVRVIQITDSGKFDLSSLLGFEVSKASNWTGGSVDGDGILTVSDGAVQVTYTYNIGQGRSETFTLEPMKEINAERILRYIVGLETFTDAEIHAADGSGDGIVTMHDAVLALRTEKES